MTENNLCKQHSGFKAQIEDLEDKVTELWKKWDGMQKMILAVFITLSLNLLGVGFLLLRALAAKPPMP